MVKVVEFFICETCGKTHSTEELAKACEARGVPKYRFSQGEFIPELELTIVALSAICNRHGHRPAYILDTEFEGSFKVGEIVLTREIESLCTCIICKTKFPSIAQAKRCEKQGYVDFIWDDRYSFTHIDIQIVGCITKRTPEGKHIAVYSVRSLKTQTPSHITQDELKRLLAS